HQGAARWNAYTDQREPPPQAIKDWNTITQKDARQAHAGYGSGHVPHRIVRDVRPGLCADHRRSWIGVTELDAETLGLGGAERGDAPHGLEPCDIALRRGCRQIATIQRRNFGAHLAVAFRGFAVAPADWSALCVVRSEQAWSTETTQHSGELPTEVASIANPGIHAVAPGRDVLVRRIPSQKHPTQSTALGHHKVRRPGISHQNLVITASASQPSQQPMWVHGLWRHVLRPTILQRPDVAIILCDQAARGRLVMPSHTPALQYVGCR